ncbi:MAG: hydrogen gas-evolving membrane-bound hydrogenase subunit E [Rhodocyclaceae bacterium]
MHHSDSTTHAPLWTRLAWLVPLGMFALLLASGPPTFGFATDWVPSLGISLAFHVDGLSRLFLTLILGIGAMVFFYAPGYLHGDPRLPRLMALLVCFMLAMVGAVTADDLVTLFLFWEATSVLSFMLVGFDNEREASRDAARQAMLITGGGGLALLGGLLLILHAAPGLRLSDLPRLDPALIADPTFSSGVVLVMLGAITKSAQLPFHGWLPGAMAAPTPVSAYLHSATMVKLGVYLLARFDEAMGATPWWEWSLVTLGSVTSLWAAILILRERDLKRILAWSTVSGLGTLTLLIGLPNEWSALAFTTFVLAHACYKAPLFFVAGNLDHLAGTRSIDHLRGMGRALPVTAASAVLAGVSMAGLPSSLGFIAKDVILTAKDMTDSLWLVGAASLLASAIGVAVAAVATIRVFFGKPNDALCRDAHEEGLRHVAPPLLIALTAVALGLFPKLAEPILLGAARMISPDIVTSDADIPALREAANLSMLGSMGLIVSLGTITYLGWDRLHQALSRLTHLDPYGPASFYPHGLAALKSTARGVTTILQDGVISHYLMTTLAATCLLMLPLVTRLDPVLSLHGTLQDAGRIVGAVTVLTGALFAVLASDTLARLLAVGLVGTGSALVFLFSGAPDLAFTQLAVETVFVVVAAVVLRRHRALDSRPTPGPWRITIAIGFGLMLGMLLLALQSAPMDGSLSDFFLRASLPEAHGRNVVNVIIVDFRALDTLGEITVVLLTALAAWPLTRVLRRKREAGT